MNCKLIFLFCLYGLVQFTECRFAACTFSEDHLEELKIVVEEKTEYALQSLKNTLKSYNYESTNTLLETITDGQRIAYSTKEKIEGIIKLAEEQEKDITHCIINYEENLDKLYETFVDRAYTCIIKKISAVNDYINDNSKKIKDSSSVYDVLAEKLGNCGTNQSCLEEIRMEICFEITNYPEVIDKQLSVVKGKMEQYHWDVEACSQSAIGLATSDFRWAYTDIYDCAGVGNDL